MKISEVPYTEMPMDLLLQADPSAQKVTAYLPKSICVIAEDNAMAVGVYVLMPIAEHVYELMNIAVSPEHQHKGLGSTLLQHAIATAQDSGARRIEVGTGSFGYQLGWYQREGFRVFTVVPDFFLTHYDGPIMENGVQLKDMIRLFREF